MAYSETYSGTISDGMMAGIMGAIGVVALVMFIWWLLGVIAGWKIFTKAGEPGWKSIIPVYSNYIIAKIAWKPLVFWIIAVGGVVASICNNIASPAINAGNAGALQYILIAVAVVLYLATAVFGIILQVRLAKSFGYGVGFAIGLLLLNPIFMLILGFGQSKYQGPIE